MIWNPWKEIKRLREQVDACHVHIKFLRGENNNLFAALIDINSQEKPTSNATVKRMAKIAREALEV